MTLIRAFLGAEGDKQTAVEGTPGYQGSPWLSEEAFIDEARINRVDFIKCDIEGGEYELLSSGSRLMSMTKSLAVEVHSFAGDVQDFIGRVKAMGFTIGPIQHDPDGTVTFLAKRGD